MADPQRPSEPRLLTALLVDDSAADVRLMREALADQRETPVRLLHADRLSTGLARLAEGGVDVVLLDLGLPDSQGLETLIKVRHHAPRVPVIVLTASDDIALAIQALQQGAQDYLVKASVQVSRDLVGRSIRYAIERHRVERLKDDFVNTVSHELRTPLATIQEFTGILFDQISGLLEKLGVDPEQFFERGDDGKWRPSEQFQGMFDQVRRMLQGEGQEPPPQPEARRRNSEPQQARPAWLGIQVEALTDDERAKWDLEEGTGVLVAEALAEGPAHRAGLRAGDVLIRLDENPVKGEETLSRFMRKAEAGKKVKMTVLRGGEEKSFTVVLGSRDE